MLTGTTWAVAAVERRNAAHRAAAIRGRERSILRSWIGMTGSPEAIRSCRILGAPTQRAGESPAPPRRSRSERHDLPGTERLVGSQHDAEALHRVLHVVAEVDVFLDRAEQVFLLAEAQAVVVRLVGGVDPLVRPR